MPTPRPRFASRQPALTDRIDKHDPGYRRWRRLSTETRFSWLRRRVARQENPGKLPRTW